MCGAFLFESVHIYHIVLISLLQLYHFIYFICHALRDKKVQAIKTEVLICSKQQGLNWYDGKQIKKYIQNP